MEEFIQIIIFVGAMVIAVIGQTAKNKKKPVTASPQEVLEDMFPDVIIEGNEEAIPQTMEKPAPIRKRKTMKKEPELRAKPPVIPVETPKKENKISLNTRQEARRAFIHSEIFNRKYS